MQFQYSVMWLDSLSYMDWVSWGRVHRSLVTIQNIGTQKICRIVYRLEGGICVKNVQIIDTSSFVCYTFEGSPVFKFYRVPDHAWSSPGGSCTDACSEKSMVCSLDLPYPDVIETIAQQECDVVLLFEQFKGIHQPG